MTNLEFKQIIEINSENLDKMTNWMYNWWGKEEGYTFDSIKCYLLNSLQKDRLPKTYGIFCNNKIVGMFHLTYSDLDIRPDLYPWLANFYIDEEYRNKGIAKILLEKIKEIAKSELQFKQIYLFTTHIGLYEKFGWEFVSEIDTFLKKPRIQRLYKLSLK